MKHLRTKLLMTMLACLFATTGEAQHLIKGTVSDSQGPLIGATVKVKDASTGTTTDLNGEFKIQVKSKKAILLFSYVGYQDQAVIVGNQKVINVILEEDAQMLDEAVVIGYGTVAKSHLTGSISKLEGESLVNAPVSDVSTALQGMMTGLTVSNQTSEVGVVPSIRVRGTGSISADSEPLIIIDGFPVQGGLSQINAADIKSIEILKDAASAAIYGSRAANGVIMITTKSGTPDKPKYSFKFYEGFKYAYQLHDMMTSTEWYQLQQEEEALGGPAATRQARGSAYLDQQIGSTDWQKEGLRGVAHITNAQFNISGGKKDLRYFVSSAYTKDQGIMKQNALDKFTFRGKLDAKLSERVSMGFNMSGTYKKTERPKNNFIDFYRTPSFLPVMHNEYTTGLTGYTGYARGSHFTTVQTPTGPVDSDGNPTMETPNPFSSANNNPASVLANTKRWGEDFQGLASVYFTVDICKGLQFKTSNGINARFSPSYYYGNKNATKDGEASNATYFSTLYIDMLTENTLTYHRDFGKRSEHTIDALLGYTAESTRNQRVAMTATGFATDDIQTLNAATVYELASSNNGNNAGTGTFRYPDVLLESYLGRVNYSYLNRYLLSASLRLDRSSLFSKGNRNAWFPSVSLGWRVSEEKFMQNVKPVSNLKLRASYGVTGNNRIQYQAAMEVLNAANYIVGTGNGQLANGTANTSSTLANSDITWEKTDEFNYGFDLGLFKNRLSISVDGYYSVTRSLLFAQPTQSFTGYNYYWNNIGKVSNKGVEIQIDSHNFNTRKFKWDTSFNFSLSRNKLLEIGGEEQIITLGERNECYIAKVGDPLIQFYGYRVIGVWNTTEEIAANPHFSQDVPGGVRIADTNGDGQLTADDRVPLGNPYPDFTWGLNNTFRYKDFDLSFLIQGVQGITVYNGDVYYNESKRYNRAYTENRWVSPEHPGDGMTPYENRGYNICLTDYPLENASYACLRNLTLGYTLPKTITRKWNITSLRCYLSGSNLLYIWSDGYRGINPESRLTSNQYSSAMISGYQRGGFPLTSTVSVGFDINF
ncbi:MAG: TonB-dependent receptor [Prevotella sp.]|nr:TonB-dependent receptor [Prevotella sp.]